MYCRIPLCSRAKKSEEDEILEDDNRRLLLSKIIFELLLFACFFEVFVTILFSSLVSNEISVCNINNNKL